MQNQNQDTNIARSRPGVGRRRSSVYQFVENDFVKQGQGQSRKYKDQLLVADNDDTDVDCHESLGFFSFFACCSGEDDENSYDAVEGLQLKDLMEWRKLQENNVEYKFLKQFRFILSQGVDVEEQSSASGKEFLSSNRSRVLELGVGAEDVKVFMTEDNVNYRVVVDRVPLKVLNIEEEHHGPNTRPSIILWGESSDYTIKLLAASEEEHDALMEGLSLMSHHERCMLASFNRSQSWLPFS